MLQSRQKTVVKAFRHRHHVSVSVSLPVSVSVLSPLTPPPLCLLLSLSLSVALFVRDSGDSRSLMLYFALALFSNIKVACTLAVIARSKPGYTVLQSRQKTVVKLTQCFHPTSFLNDTCVCMCVHVCACMRAYECVFLNVCLYTHTRRHTRMHAQA